MGCFLFGLLMLGLAVMAAFGDGVDFSADGHSWAGLAPAGYGITIWLFGLVLDWRRR